MTTFLTFEDVQSPTMTSSGRAIAELGESSELRQTVLFKIYMAEGDTAAQPAAGLATVRLPPSPPAKECCDFAVLDWIPVA